MSQHSQHHTVIVLTDKSQKNLKSKLENFIPNDWIELSNEHVIEEGPASDNYKSHLGKKFTLIVKEIGFCTQTIAVKVSCDEIKSKDKIPHITLATNPYVKGNTRASNDIVDWISLKPFLNKNELLTVEGILQEINRDV